VTLSDFRHVYFVDFEFSSVPGERPVPICLVAREYRSGRTIRLWEKDLCRRTEAPYPTDDATLFVAYYASAEIGCHAVLGWPAPANVLDLFAEFRNVTNGLTTPCGNGLLGALASFGLDGIDTAEKDSMRELAIRGGPWTADERSALLDYCEQDVVALARLLPEMLPVIDLDRALVRGRYMVAAAWIEAVGVPIDTAAHGRLTTGWDQIKDRLIERIDADYRVYDGRTFKARKFARYLTANEIPWPHLPSGTLALDDDTFRDMVRSHPCLGPLRELRVSLAQLRLAGLAVGQDGRNRCLLSAFRARTGRNQPSNSRFIFGPAVWLRGLIRPEPGHGLAYVDWSQQEFGIAAALSGDPHMMEAYASGDPYLAFAKQAGAVPASATKQTHPGPREQFKACALAVQYGMGDVSLGHRTGQSPAQARELLTLHHDTYRKFWRWSDATLDFAHLHGSIHTAFGWTLHLGAQVNPRSLRNFPMQANGAEMLRLACCFATERGIRVCAPVHDALLIEAPLGQLDDAIEMTQRAMAEASRAVLDGFALRTDMEVIHYPNRYVDPRGKEMWDRVFELLGEVGPGTQPDQVAEGGR
jgi:DNA polymerase-1